MTIFIESLDFNAYKLMRAKKLLSHLYKYIMELLYFLGMVLVLFMYIYSMPISIFVCLKAIIIIQLHFKEEPNSRFILLQN